MRIYNDISEFSRLENAVVTNGMFDGVHHGHVKILNQLKSIAKETNGETVVISFWPHPRVVLTPDNHGIELLTSLEEKISVFKNIGIDHLIIMPFTKEFASKSSEDYIKKILVEAIGTKHLVIGYDHKFGRNQEGSFEHLKKHSTEYGFEVDEIARQDVDDVGVSSTKIREAIKFGKLEVAERYLGRPYRISGVVIHGDELGRKIGFPTANISIEEPLKLIPAEGAYAVRVLTSDKEYDGMLNIGIRPTVAGTNQQIEVHLFDFTGDLYDQILQIDFVRKIRDEIKFDSIDSLKVQLKSDAEEAMNILKV